MWHPDKNEHTIELARRKFDEIKIALDILSDETLRNQYDLKQFTHVVGMSFRS
jgi:DnaJ-class molecular chaperone